MPRRSIMRLDDRKQYLYKIFRSQDTILPPFQPNQTIKVSLYTKQALGYHKTSITGILEPYFYIEILFVPFFPDFQAFGYLIGNILCRDTFPIRTQNQTAYNTVSPL